MKISRQKIFGRADAAAVNIVFGVDAPFVPIMGICMTSLLKNNPARKFAFHIFLDDIDACDEDKLAELSEQFSAQITLYFLPADLYEDFYLEGDYTRAIFYRIAAADFLAQHLEKIIYMDADMICLKPLDELFDLPQENFLLAAVVDPGGVNSPEHKKNFGFSADYLYFNTGLLCINLAQWRAEKISSQVLEILSRGKYPFPDQDALNLVVDRRAYPIKFLPDRYNYFFRVNGVERSLRDDVAIQHFTGQLKPWHPWCESPLKEIFETYKNISPWRDFVYQPRNYQEYRRMGRVCRRAGKWFEALKWYFSYFQRRHVEKK